MANTLHKDEYIKKHILWSLILFLWGKKLFFRCIPNCTHNESLFVLLLVAICVMGIGIFLTWKRNRSYSSLAENIIMTWSVFVILAYVDLYKNRIIIISLVTAMVSVLMTLFVIGRKIKRQDKKRQIIRKRLRNIITLWRRNITYASLFLLVPLGASIIFNGTILKSNVEVVKVYGDEHCLDANIEVIADIAPERWDDLDVQQKLNVCQKIINCEGRYLGLSHEIAIGIAELSEGTLAYYSEAQHQIVIDIDHLTDSYSYDVLETLIHEVTHAYQYEQVALYQRVDEESRNLLMFYDASIYIKEFANYEDGSDDFLHYYCQKAEIDARKAGKTESLEYIRRINEYLYGEE